jgi:hypothetical protein
MRDTNSSEYLSIGAKLIVMSRTMHWVIQLAEGGQPALKSETAGASRSSIQNRNRREWSNLPRERIHRSLAGGPTIMEWLVEMNL